MYNLCTRLYVYTVFIYNAYIDLQLMHLQFSQSGLTLSSPDAYSDNRTGPSNLAALNKFIVSTLSLIQPSGNTTLFQEAADGIVDFETNLAKVRGML